MAIKLSQVKRLNSVHIISKRDDAVDEEQTEWDRYDEDPVNNLDAIKYHAEKEATKFICNFEQTGKEVASIKDAMIKGFDDDKNPMVAYGKWAYTVARMTLKDIQNPPNVGDVIIFKKDGKGYVTDEILTKLERLGIVQEIFQHWIHLTQDDSKPQAKN